MPNEFPEANSAAPRRRLVVLAGIAALIVVLSALFLWSRAKSSPGKETKATEAAHADEHHEEENQKEVKLSPETLAAAKLETAEVVEQASGGAARVTGTVEANQQEVQQATPLVSGRIEQVSVVLGDRVQKGQVLAVISSPQIAQLHGKLHEAETRLALAERNLTRVLQAENRAAVVTAKAKLDEAEATLKRTRRLIELGAGAGKDLVAAETVYQTAKAEYEFQRNIALNRETQEARAAVETARVDVAHIRDEMKSLGAPVSKDEHSEHGDAHQRDTSLLVLRAPASGTVTERLVNPGAGVEAGKPLFTLANLSTLWVIANVPEAHVGRLRVGAPALMHAAALEGASLTGRVNYISPSINEETRTASVRVEVSNPRGRLKTGMFVEVEFQTLEPGTNEKELAVPEAALQRIGERAIVFIAEEEPGHFQVRDVEVGAERNGMRRILAGLKAGERVVTKGSFTLKTQLQKGELEEEGH